MKTFLGILGYLLIMFIIWSVGNGTFDISIWSESAKMSYSILSGFGIVCYFIGKLIF